MVDDKNREIYLTQEGLENVKEELKVLKLENRPEIIRAIKEARALGDLSENADYHSAREEQAFIESRIQELEALVDNAIIIKKNRKDEIGIGSTIVIEYTEDKEQEEYTIVGSKETNPSENKISNESPIAKSIIGHKKGEILTVDSPNGKYEIKIIEIK
ncbi:MAG: transcription elongation factor GreA [Mollicutes bacterium]|nr:transcription elongation factor GreA [Mollicutes bacterium]